MSGAESPNKTGLVLAKGGWAVAKTPHLLPSQPLHNSVLCLRNFPMVLFAPLDLGLPIRLQFTALNTAGILSDTHRPRNAESYMLCLEAGRFHRT